MSGIEDLCQLWKFSADHIPPMPELKRVKNFLYWAEYDILIRRTDWSQQEPDTPDGWLVSSLLTFSRISFFLCSLCLLVRSAAISGVSPPALPRHTGWEATGQLPCSGLVRSDICQEEYLALLVLLRAWTATGNRSRDDTALCCREEIVWSRPVSQYSPS